MDPGNAIRRLASSALDLALPATCVGCGSEGRPLCRRCAPILDVRLARPPGVPIGLPSPIPRPLLQLEWCAPYSGVVRRAVHDLKYRGERRLAEPLGAAMARRWAVAGAGGDVLVPVPADRGRVRERGYDQAALLARAAGRRLGLPVAELVVRVRTTVAQFDLDHAARATNVRGAFTLAGIKGGPAGISGSPDSLTGPVTGSRAGPRLERIWFVLVDDVVTTGATLAGCAQVLMDAGALGVSALTVARER